MTIKGNKTESKGNTGLTIAMAVIALLEIVGFVIALGNHGIGIMGFYTQQSNLVLLIAALVMLFNLRRGKLKWANSIFYVATSMVIVTFCTVVFVFVPMLVPSGTKAVLAILFGGANLYHHFLGPLLAVIVFIAMKNDYRPTIKEALIATGPTMLYAIVSTSLNVLKVIRGPYPFLYVYEQPVIVSVIWFFAIPFTGFLFALLIRWLRKLRTK